VTEIIGSELHLETVGRGLPRRQSHDARVVDEQIERGVRGDEVSGETGDRGKIGQIERFETDFSIRELVADFRDRFAAFGFVTPVSTTSAPACARRIAV
jgi:hypothetical protein